MPAPRTIQTPGEPTAPAVKPEAVAAPAPAPKPDATAAAAAAPTGDATDNLDLYEGDELPPAPAAAAAAAPTGMVSLAEVQAMLDAQAAKFQAQMVDAIRAAKSSQDPATAAKLARARIEENKVPTIEAARAMCEAAVAQGNRPRAILTDQGWYCHPEMARAKATGVGALGGAV